MSSASGRRVAAPLIVGLVGLALGALLAIRTLAFVDWDPSIFIAFGEEAPETLEYGYERLGTDIYIRTEYGHDGKFFFVQANDPWLLDPDTNASVLDRPAYRSQRMLYPLLAGGFGFFGPEAVSWAMLATNVVALGVGTWGTASLAQRMGGSTWWGLAFVLNLGVVSEMLIGGGGAVAFAMGVWALVAILRGSLPEAAAWMTGAVLAREAMLIMAFGAGFWLVRRTRRWWEAALLAAIPLSAAGLWAIYVRARVGWSGPAGEIEEIGWPFLGLIKASRIWWIEPRNVLVGLTIVLLLAVFTRRVLRTDWLVGWATIGFVPLAIVFTWQVWLSYFDISRAVAPILTAFVLVAFVGGNRSGDVLELQAGDPSHTRFGP